MFDKIIVTTIQTQCSVDLLRSPQHAERIFISKDIFNDGFQDD